MHLSMAIGMDQNTVAHSVCSSHRFVYDVVVMPARHLRDWLCADRAVTALLSPKVGQATFPSQGLFHLYAEAFFKIGFPCGVVWVTGSFYFCVSGDRCCRGSAEPIVDRFSFLVFCRPEEAPVLITKPPKIAVGNPPPAFLRVPTSCPSPQRFEDCRVHLDKGFFCRSMLVKIGPPPYCGVAYGYEPMCCGLFVIPHDFSDACKKRLYSPFAVQKVQKLNFQGGRELWVDYPLSP